MEQTLLLNWVYYYPVGHCVEALKVAKGDHDANPNLRIAVALNVQTPVVLAEACLWIDRAYPVDTYEVAQKGLEAPSLRAIPPAWDYVVSDERLVNYPASYAAHLKAFHDVAVTYFQARRWQGARRLPPSDGAPDYVLDAPMRFRLPDHAQAHAARYQHSHPRLCVLLAGSSSEPLYPPLRWWIRLLHTLREAFPGGQLYVTGVTPREQERSVRACYPRQALDRLFRACPDVVDGYDIGLWNQLALIQECDVFIAPHTGFAFVAPCVGTPWPALSGGRWPEYFFNRTPFYCVLPDCPRYPCYVDMKAACVRRIEKDQPVLCMDARQLTPRIPEVVVGVDRLLDPEFTYEQAVDLYRRQIQEAGSERSRLFSFDGCISFPEA